MGFNKIIALTDRAPIEIDPEAWPQIAFAEGWEGRHRFQAFRDWFVAVRRHPSLGTAVYGSLNTRWDGESDLAAGVFLDSRDADPAERDLVDAIREVAEDLGHPELARDVIQALPAELLADLAA